jgi:hypothetical protein
MTNPFRPPLHETNFAPAKKLHINILLLLLSIIVTYMLTTDIQHLLAIYNNALARGAEISIFHYIYLKFAALEIAYFRIASSITILILLLFSARNYAFIHKHYFIATTYGITQLIYQALAITGVVLILSQVLGTSSPNLDFWLSPAMLSISRKLLLDFLFVAAPPLIYLALLIITRLKITVHQAPSMSRANNRRPNH